MKLIAAIAFLTLIIAFAAAESSSESQCRREMQQHSLDRCRSFMKYGRQQQGLLMTGIEDSTIEDEDESEMMAPRECCQQLRQTSEQCRCPMIRQMMRQMQQEEGFEGQECRGRCGEMMMRGRFLPAMCGMEPHICRMRQGRGY